MKTVISTVLLATLFTVGVAANAQDKTKSEPSGQEKMQPDGMGSKPAMAPKGAMQMDKSTGMGMGMGMGSHDFSAMDTNNDGMVSKAEFMKFHEAMYDRMKGTNGMLSMSDMSRRTDGRMNDMPRRGEGSSNDPSRKGDGGERK